LLQFTRLTDGRTDGEFSSLDSVCIDCITCSAVKIKQEILHERDVTMANF